MSGYVKTFNNGNKNKNKNNKLISFRIDEDKLSEKYKTILNKIEELKKVLLNALPVYDDKYTTTKIKTQADNVYTIFCDLNFPEDGVECESFKIISVESLLVY